MARDSEGVYSLPAGNPETPRTRRSSAVYNNTLADIVAALNDMPYVEGSFSATFSAGFASPPSGTIKYIRIGSSVTLYADADMTGTSNGASLTMDGVPALLRPSVARMVYCGKMTATSLGIGRDLAIAIVKTDGTIEFSIPVVVDTTRVVSGGTWPSSLTKGLLTGWTINYPL